MIVYTCMWPTRQIVERGDGLDAIEIHPFLKPKAQMQANKTIANKHMPGTPIFLSCWGEVVGSCETCQLAHRQDVALSNASNFDQWCTHLQRSPKPLGASDSVRDSDARVTALQSHALCRPCAPVVHFAALEVPTSRAFSECVILTRSPMSSLMKSPRSVSLCTPELDRLENGQATTPSPPSKSKSMSDEQDRDVDAVLLFAALAKRSAPWSGRR